MSTAADNFTILGREGFVDYPDVQRDWTWVAEFQSKEGLVTSVGEEGLLIRCKSISIPQGGINPLESNFYGAKQYFASKPLLGHTVNCMFEETEDLFVQKLFYNWRQQIYDITTGGSQVNSKKDYSTTLKLYLTKYNKAPNGCILFENLFPTNLTDIALSYDSDNKINVNVTFNFDRWQFLDSTGTTKIA